MERNPGNDIADSPTRMLRWFLRDRLTIFLVCCFYQVIPQCIYSQSIGIVVNEATMKFSRLPNGSVDCEDGSHCVKRLETCCCFVLNSKLVVINYATCNEKPRIKIQPIDTPQFVARKTKFFAGKQWISMHVARDRFGKRLSGGTARFSDRLADVAFRSRFEVTSYIQSHIWTEVLKDELVRNSVIPISAVNNERVEGSWRAYPNPCAFIKSQCRISNIEALASTAQGIHGSLSTNDSGFGRFLHLTKLLPIDNGNYRIDNKSCNANSNNPPFPYAKILRQCVGVLCFAVGVVIGAFSWWVMVARRCNLRLNSRVAVFLVGYLVALVFIWHGLKFTIFS
jgi:hypothetical protein